MAIAALTIGLNGLLSKSVLTVYPNRSECVWILLQFRS